jgi:hypothetical protein
MPTATIRRDRRHFTRNMNPEQIDAFDRLREIFPKGSTVYTILSSVSASGMTRWINVYGVRQNRPVYAAGLMAVAWPDHWKRGKWGSGNVDSLKVEGAGMDMGFHVAYSLAQSLYGDGYALNHRWL